MKSIMGNFVLAVFLLIQSYGEKGWLLLFEVIFSGILWIVGLWLFYHEIKG